MVPIMPATAAYDATSLMGPAALRLLPLLASVLLHVIVYDTLLLVPSPMAAARLGLMAELVPSEPAPVAPASPLPPRVRTVRPPVRSEPAPVGSVVSPSSTVPPSKETASAPPAPAPAPAADSNNATGGRNAVVVAPTDEPMAKGVPAGEASAGGAPVESSSPPMIAALPPGPAARTAIPRGGYQVKPDYPTSARRLGIEGTALLGVRVETDGRVGDVVLKQSAGHPDLDRAAAEAVRRWRFEPARRGRDAVSMWVEVPVEFRLR
jgi:periplasmic protein TonB